MEHSDYTGFEAEAQTALVMGNSERPGVHCKFHCIACIPAMGSYQKEIDVFLRGIIHS